MLLLLLAGLFSCTLAIAAVHPALTAIRLTGQAPADESTGSEEGGTAYKIVIDPGHGGKDPGADGNSGLEEKDFTLALAREVYELLKREPMFEPYLTRTDDTFVALEARAAFANERDADALISIHGNTFHDPAVGGTETYYYSEESEQLANAIHRQLVAASGFVDRGVRHNDLKVLRLTRSPAILAEVGFLSNPNDEAVLLDRDRQARLARAIVDGLKQYFAADAMP